jgi:acetyl-CoA acetyltransferase
LTRHPYSEVAIAAVHNTRCARVLEGSSSLSLSCDAALAVLAESGVERTSIDGIAGPEAQQLAYFLGVGPLWTVINGSGISLVNLVANAIAAGNVETVLVVEASAGLYTDRGGTAPWTRPSNEFVVATGMFTAVEFALIARRHMEMFGTKPEHLAAVAATIRNNGHINPKAAYFGRGPYTPDDILASRMVASPFHLLDCSMTSEGGCAMVMTTVERAKDLPVTPVHLLGFGDDRMGPSYQHPPAWDLRSADPSGIPLGYVGRRAAQAAFSTAGLSPADVDVCEFYDPFSFEIIRQYEAFGFCGDGEGGDFVMEGNIAPGGRYPVTTDGGLLSFNHSRSPQMLQRVARGVQQLQGTCETNQVPGAEVAMCSNLGAGAMASTVVLLGNERP